MLNTASIEHGTTDRVRHALHVPSGDELRISYLCGPGDVEGTFRYWRDGAHDPRVPVVTYSGMFYDLVHALQARGQVVTQVPNSTVKDDRIQFTSVSRRPSNGRLGHLFAERAYASACVRAVNEFAPHVVVVATDIPSSTWAALGAGRKLVLAAHNSFWPMGRRRRDVKSRLKLALLSRQLRHLDAAVCTSNECMRQIDELSGGTVPCTVELPQVVAEYPVETRGGSARKLLFLGRIEENKGVYLLLNSFLKVAQAVKGLTLDFAGTGSADAELNARITASGVATVRHLGKLDSAGVHAAIAGSDLVVCPTTSRFNEGLAVVPMEAAAHGIPALLSSVVPAAEALGEGCMVFEADNADALQQALIAATTNAEAYQAMSHSLATLRPLLYDRSLSWGSQLGQALTLL